MEIKTSSTYIAPKPSLKGCEHMLVILKKNPTSTNLYRVVRCQQRSLKSQLRKVQQIYPTAEIIAEIIYTANSIRLFNRLHEQLDYMKRRYNDIELKNVKINTFISDIKRLCTYSN